jgi:formylglycine-generating enzyme required for sulfatase activity
VRNVEPAAIDAFLAAWSLRLPTLAEFTFALETRRGDRSWWGNTLEPPRDHARLNIADQARREQSPLAPYLPGYEDGVPGVAAAADPRFVQGRGRAFHHLLGNVAEWVTEGASSVVLGGSYMTSSWETFECRYRQPVLGSKRQDLGFRAARSVPTGN